MRPGCKPSFLATVGLILVACTATPTQESTPTEFSTPKILPTPSQESIPTAVSVPTILPTPSSIVPLEERLIATIDIKFPDELVFVQGFIWVKTDDGHLIQVDPATNSVVSDITVDTTTDYRAHFCQGLGTDGQDIWACSARGDADNKIIDVVRIDPSSQTIIATTEVGKIFDQFTMPFLLNHIWVLTDNGNKLVGIDITTDQPGSAIDLGARCFQVAAMGSSLLVTCKLDNLLLQVDPESMQVTERRTFSSPWNIAMTEDGIWVGQRNAVVRLDSESLEPVTTFTSLPGDKGLFSTREAVWVRLDDGFLYRIDPVTNRLVEQIISDQRFYNMGSVFVTPDDIWTTAGDDDMLLRLSLE